MTTPIETSDLWAVYSGELEIRQGGRIFGRFPYGSMATVADRGRQRKETFASRAFAFAIEDDTREINLLVGHRFDAPLASRLEGTLEISDSADAVEFVATLPPENRRPTYMQDAALAIENRLMRGLSPGFRVPPATAVPNAEELIPEPGGAGVLIRRINQAVLFELSIVTRPSYTDSDVEIRAQQLLTPPDDDLWLLTL